LIPSTWHKFPAAHWVAKGMSEERSHGGAGHG
jgi:hypothetical protein